MTTMVALVPIWITDRRRGTKGQNAIALFPFAAQKYKLVMERYVDNRIGVVLLIDRRRRVQSIDPHWVAVPYGTVVVPA